MGARVAADSVALAESQPLFIAHHIPPMLGFELLLLYQVELFTGDANKRHEMAVLMIV